jgi:hypothetical protein
MIFNSSGCTKPGCGTLGVMSLDPFLDSDHKVQFYFCAIEIFFILVYSLTQRICSSLTKVSPRN